MGASRDVDRHDALVVPALSVSSQISHLEFEGMSRGAPSRKNRTRQDGMKLTGRFESTSRQRNGGVEKLGQTCVVATLQLPVGLLRPAD
jgi:hypothetical protein